MELNVEYFREVLTRNNISNRQFAREAGVCHSTITKILNENMKPGMKSCKAIIKGLPNEPIDKLFKFSVTK